MCLRASHQSVLYALLAKAAFKRANQLDLTRGQAYEFFILEFEVTLKQSSVCSSDQGGPGGASRQQRADLPGKGCTCSPW